MKNNQVLNVKKQSLTVEIGMDQAEKDALVTPINTF